MKGKSNSNDSVSLLDFRLAKNCWVPTTFIIQMFKLHYIPSVLALISVILLCCCQMYLYVLHIVVNRQTFGLDE